MQRTAFYLEHPPFPSIFTNQCAEQDPEACQISIVVLYSKNAHAQAPVILTVSFHVVFFTGSEMPVSPSMVLQSENKPLVALASRKTRTKELPRQNNEIIA